MPHQEVLRGRLDALRSARGQLIDPPVGRGGGGGVFIPPFAPPTLVGPNGAIVYFVYLNMAFGVSSDQGIYGTGSVGELGPGTIPKLALPVAVRVLGLGASVVHNTMTQNAKVALLADGNPVAVLEINPGQTGPITTVTSQTLPQGTLVWFKADMAAGQPSTAELIAHAAAPFRLLEG